MDYLPYILGGLGGLALAYAVVRAIKKTDGLLSALALILLAGPCDILASIYRGPSPRFLAGRKEEFDQKQGKLF